MRRNSRQSLSGRRVVSSLGRVEVAVMEAMQMLTQPPV